VTPAAAEQTAAAQTAAVATSAGNQNGRIDSTA
jgi:hypothetical protein